MRTITSTELRQDLFTILTAIEDGDEEIVITRNERVVAKISPLRGNTRRPKIDQAAIETFCRKHSVRTFSLFGSILREDFGPLSDVDVLFDPEPKKRYSFKEHMEMKRELESMFGRSVDLIDRKVFMNHRNEIRKKDILDSAKIIFTTETR